MRLLIVGGMKGPIAEAGRVAVRRGAKVAHAETLDQALQSLRNGVGADLAMVDVALDVGGFIAALTAERIALPVVACGVDVDPQAAVRAIRAGAREFVPLPPDAELIGAILAAISDDSLSLIWRDPAMERVVKLARQVAATDATVLITGESGTGKEVFARFLHQHSRRKEAVFVAVNCAAIPENLLESELFGHERGAFTGAVARRVGKFEEAHGGTLLLDEISEMDPRLQAKLLRAIQEREIDRVGGTRPVPVDVRLIATSNRDLPSAVRSGSFREDLYYRLNVFNLELPPLRDRPQDVAALSAHFVKHYCALNDLGEKHLDPSALSRLTAHDWPGNVRELENTIQRAVLLSPDAAIAADAVLLTAGAQTRALRAAPAPPEPEPGEPGSLVGRTVADVERTLILDTLDHCLGNRTHAATILGISIRTLRNKLKQYADEGAAVALPREGAASAG